MPAGCGSLHTEISASIPGVTPPEILHWLHSRRDAMQESLRRYVVAESPSFNKAPVDRLGRRVAADWRRVGARVNFLRQRERGDHVRAEVWLGRGRPEGQILVLGHLDTVYPLGALAQMPWRVSRGRACGPGTLDMKSGLVIALYAVAALRRAGIRPRKKFVFLWTTDEEIGSGTSRAAIEREARRSQAALVLEPGAGLEGRLKTARKGVGEVELRVTGRAAHAGVNPAGGINAVHELALQIGRIARFNEPRRGITVNADVVSGGTRTNVIAEQAVAQIDVRVTRAADARRLGRKFRALRPILRGAKLEIRGGVDRPPMERTAGVVWLLRMAESLAGQMGLEVKESFTGGGSDGNFTAAIGTPTLDGLGGAGAGAHTRGEFVFVDSLPRRAALLAQLLAHI